MIRAAHQPRIIDLFCGLGGAARGYQRAGFYVVGVDNVPQPDYCGDEFVQGSALDFLVEYGDAFDAAHGSPPCQASCAPTKGTNKLRNTATRRRHPNYIPAVRALLDLSGLPYIIENVQGSALRRDLTLCGLMFQRPLYRHRYFELGGGFIMPPRHCRPGVDHRGHRVRGWRHGEYYDGDILAVYGDGGGKATTEECRDALGIDWSWDRPGLIEAIPPVYTEYIGAGLQEHLRLAA